jgi:hypothetical protein
MKKEKVFIVVSHKNSLKPKLRVRTGTADDWEITETVEFVNQIRNRHTSMSSAIGDYINRKMITGARYDITDYEKFEGYVRSKYPKQMAELDAAYNTDRPVIEEKASPEVFVDPFGNVRAKTVFDPV